jgi:transcriptional regulator with XRE-family HTH domain
MTGNTRAPRWRRRIGGRIKNARLRAGLRQYELAAMAGISDTCLRRWEQGRGAVTLPELSIIAAATHTTLAHYLEVIPVEVVGVQVRTR